MPRGLKTKLKIGRTKIEKGVPPMLGKGMPKSRAMPFAQQKSSVKVIPTLRGRSKPKF